MHYSSTPTTYVDAALRDLAATSAPARCRAADALARATTRLDEVAAALREALKDPADDVRFAAALALGTLGDLEAVDVLIGLLSDPSPLGRQGAAKALGDLGDPRAFDALAGLVADPVADVRFQLPAALLEVSPRRATPALLALLRDSDAEVRGSAAAALGDLYACAAHETRDDDEAPPPLAGTKPPEDVIEALTRRLEDTDDAVLLDAAIALGRLGDPRATPRLLEHLADRDRALLAAAHLFDHPPRQAQDALARHAGRFFIEPAVRVYLAGALARLGDPRGHDLLRRALFGRNTLAQGLAIELCGRIPEAWTRDLLEALRQHRRGKTRRSEIDEALAAHESL